MLKQNINAALPDTDSNPVSKRPNQMAQNE